MPTEHFIGFNQMVQVGARVCSTTLAVTRGIYRLVDMGATTVNVMGNMVGSILVSHSERRAP